MLRNIDALKQMLGLVDPYVHSLSSRAYSYWELQRLKNPEQLEQYFQQHRGMFSASEIKTAREVHKRSQNRLNRKH